MRLFTVFTAVLTVAIAALVVGHDLQANADLFERGVDNDNAMLMTREELWGDIANLIARDGYAGADITDFSTRELLDELHARVSFAEDDLLAVRGPGAKKGRNLPGKPTGKPVPPKKGLGGLRSTASGSESDGESDLLLIPKKCNHPVCRGSKVVFYSKKELVLHTNLHKAGLL